MYLAIIALPLLGSIVSGFFGRKVGVKGAQFITSLSIGITTCIAILIFYEVGLNSVPVYVLTYRWIDSESLNVLWGFKFRFFNRFNVNTGVNRFSIGTYLLNRLHESWST